MNSYTIGPSLALVDHTVADLLERAARHSPETLAVISRHQNLHITYAELYSTARRVAAGLHEIGLRPGDRVGVWAANCVEWIYIQYAAAQLGLVLVNVNPACRSHDLTDILARSHIKALFFHEKDDRVNYTGVLAAARSGQATQPLQAILFESDLWRNLLLTAELSMNVSVHPDDVVCIQYTSGTTRFPKGVMLSHRNVVNNAIFLARELGITPQDRLCAPVPLHHCFGYVVSSLLAVAARISLVLPAPFFDPSATMRTIQEERCTVLHGVPTMFLAYLTHPDFPKYSLTSLRTGIIAGAHCSAELMARIIRDLPCPSATIAYGLTECSPAITMSAAGDPEDLRRETVGRVLPCTEVKIVDPSGKTAGEGEPGELCARGYLVMRAYDEEPEATARVIDSEGWLHTGDLALKRPDGRFCIVGRLKEMIIRGGENVNPVEVEEYLQSHPEIDEACVFGVSDQRLGEVVTAWVRLRPGASVAAADIQAFCHGKIAKFKIPEHIRFVGSFPMTATGKLQRSAVCRKEIELSAIART